MATWQALRDRVVSYMGEFDDQAPVADAGARVDNDTILEELLASYVELFSRAAERGPSKFVRLQTITWTGSSKTFTLSSASTSLEHAKVRSIYDQTDGADEPIPVRLVERASYDRWLRDGHEPGGEYDEYHVFLESQYAYIFPIPTSDLTLEVAYILPPSDAITTSNWDSTSPDRFPSEHHNLVALDAAVSLLQDMDMVPVSLERRHARKMQDFLEWAARSRVAGPRHVGDR